MDHEGASVRIRPAVPADAEGIAALHVEVWRDTYRHLAPADAIRLLDQTRRLPQWQAILDPLHSDTGALVAEVAGQPVGVIAHGPARHPALRAATEIKHLYVHRKAQGSGVGRALLMAAFGWLRDGNCPEVALAVVHQNTKARAFYRRMGGRECGTFVDPGPLWRSENVVVAWSLLPPGPSAPGSG